MTLITDKETIKELGAENQIKKMIETELTTNIGKLPEEICECEHEKSFHELTGGCIYGLTIGNDGEMVNRGCDCKEYKPKNHTSQNGKPSGVDGVENQLQQKEVRGFNSRTATSLRGDIKEEIICKIEEVNSLNERDVMLISRALTLAEEEQNKKVEELKNEINNISYGKGNHMLAKLDVMMKINKIFSKKADGEGKYRGREEAEEEHKKEIENLIIRLKHYDKLVFNKKVEELRKEIDFDIDFYENWIREMLKTKKVYYKETSMGYLRGFLNALFQLRNNKIFGTKSDGEELG